MNNYTEDFEQLEKLESLNSEKDKRIKELEKELQKYRNALDNAGNYLISR